MPDPARAADRSISLVVRLGVPAAEAPGLIARITDDVTVRLVNAGHTDVSWLLQLAARARQRASHDR